MNSLLSRFYPEAGAGGYSRIDGTVEFYGRVNALLHPGMGVLDFEAGSFDLILSDHVFEHVADLKYLREEFYRVLKLGDGFVRVHRTVGSILALAQILFQTAGIIRFYAGCSRVGR